MICSIPALSQNKDLEEVKECTELYQQDKFTEASECFKKHSANTYAWYFTAVIANLQKDKKTYKEYSKKLIAKKTSTANTYRLYAELNDKDSARYIKVINKGLKHFPHDTTLLICKINFYIAKKDYQKTKPLLKELIQYKKSGKHTLHFALGYACEVTGDTAGAFEGYRQAIAIDSNYFDPWYNAAALFYNRAVDLYDAANKELNDQKYQEKTALAKEELKKALPYLLKADRIIPNDPIVLESLQSVYYRLHMLNEHSEITKRIKELRKK
jgi:tetratricopeptide (TPR) repeat protein